MIGLFYRLAMFALVIMFPTERSVAPWACLSGVEDDSFVYLFWNSLVASLHMYNDSIRTPFGIRIEKRGQRGGVHIQNHGTQYCDV